MTSLIYAAQRILMFRHSMTREFNRSEISKVTPVSGWQPKTDEYQRLKKNGRSAEWTGVPLSYMLNLVSISPEANYVAYFAYDKAWDSVDMSDALHPQTLLVKKKISLEDDGGGFAEECRRWEGSDRRFLRLYVVHGDLDQ